MNHPLAEDLGDELIGHQEDTSGRSFRLKFRITFVSPAPIHGFSSKETNLVFPDDLADFLTEK